jgi:hypothetical protein
MRHFKFISVFVVLALMGSATFLVGCDEKTTSSENSTSTESSTSTSQDIVTKSDDVAPAPEIPLGSITKSHIGLIYDGQGRSHEWWELMVPLVNEKLGVDVTPSEDDLESGRAFGHVDFSKFDYKGVLVPNNGKYKFLPNTDSRGEYWIYEPETYPGMANYPGVVLACQQGPKHVVCDMYQ